VLEDTRNSLEIERTRLQAQVRDLEHAQMQTSHSLASTQEELARQQAANRTAASEEKELQARLAMEVEERERALQEVHQLRKQVSL